jgi:hypothetical protein
MVSGDGGVSVVRGLWGGVFAGELGGVGSRGVEVCVLSTRSKVERLEVGLVSGGGVGVLAEVFLAKRPELSLARSYCFMFASVVTGLSCLGCLSSYILMVLPTSLPRVLN